MLSHAKIGTSTVQSRATAGVAGRDLHLLPAGIAGRLPRRRGTASLPLNSITARVPAISSRSCRGSTSTCGGLKPRRFSLTSKPP
jgi:molybdopterin biosynthesis enzyme MoaB